MTVLTRIEIADLVADAFGPDGATREDLLAIATSKGAHPVVLEKLRELPDRHFSTMRALWHYIPEVPVD